MIEGRIDALCDAYVDDFCALDPLTATEIGVAGHEGEMTDFSPAGFDARAALTRAAVAAVEAATPVDDREAAARDAFLERTRLEIELEEAGVSRSRMSVLWSPLHQVREVFDLMPTEGLEAVAARRRTRRPRGTPRHPCRRGPQGQRGRRPAVRRGGRAGAPLDRPGR
jgi:uncharacterized protein (DUF885 family)